MSYPLKSYLATWRPFFSWKSILVPLICQEMTHWLGRNPIRRIVCQVLRNRTFCITLRQHKDIQIQGRYKEYADFHAIVEVFIDKVYDLTSINCSPSCIIDVGAHIGTFSLLAAKTFPSAHVVAFEPDPDNFILLQTNIRRNCIKVDSHNYALADFEGKTYLAGPTSMGRHIGATTGHESQVRKLTHSVDLNKISRLLLKIDVEGAEWMILADCCNNLPKSTILFVETHGGQTDLERLRALAARYGFQYDHSRSKGEYHENVLRRGEFVVVDLAGGIL